MDTKYIVNLSGGKDSTAMLLMLLEKGCPVDYILFADTGKDFPQMQEHLRKLAEYIKEHHPTAPEITIPNPVALSFTAIVKAFTGSAES